MENSVLPAQFGCELTFAPKNKYILLKFSGEKKSDLKRKSVSIHCRILVMSKQINDQIKQLWTWHLFTVFELEFDYKQTNK